MQAIASYRDGEEDLTILSKKHIKNVIHYLFL